jgi:hypothetical protein
MPRGARYADLPRSARYTDLPLSALRAISGNVSAAADVVPSGPDLAPDAADVRTFDADLRSSDPAATTVSRRPCPQPDRGEAASGWVRPAAITAANCPAPPAGGGVSRMDSPA